MIRVVDQGGSLWPAQRRQLEAFGRALPAGAKVAAPWVSAEDYMFFAPQGRYLNVLDPIFMRTVDERAYLSQRRLFDRELADMRSTASTPAQTAPSRSTGSSRPAALSCERGRRTPGPTRRVRVRPRASSIRSASRARAAVSGSPPRRRSAPATSSSTPASRHGCGKRAGCSWPFQVRAN
jgi:hypothetical protein